MRALCVLWCCALTGPVQGGAVEDLHRFLGEVQTFSARAIQTQVGADPTQDIPARESRSQFQFSRPDRFRWEYTTPYKQLIVADGSKVWVYDEDLKQVTARSLQGILTETPAALLAGRPDVARDYVLSDAGTRDGRAWVSVVPRSRNQNFERILLGFTRGGSPQGRISAIEIEDLNRQVTRIRFEDVIENPSLSTAQFRFKVPKGVDVVEEGAP